MLPSIRGNAFAEDQYTDTDWVTVIAEIDKCLIQSHSASTYPAPGSREFNKAIDHTLLKTDATATQIDALCAEASAYGFAAVCVRPNFVQRCSAALRDTDVRIASVIGFHEGTYELIHKLQETKQSLVSGAHELDIVLNYPQLIARQYAAVFAELTQLRQHAPSPILLKLILETSQLDSAQIIAACTLAGAAGFDYVKTSTGFHGLGATVQQVRLMKACCIATGWRWPRVKPAREGLGLWGGEGLMRVKASGGIRSLPDAETMLAAGASRLGTSGSVMIAKEGRRIRDAGEHVQAGEAMKASQAVDDY